MQEAKDIKQEYQKQVDKLAIDINILNSMMGSNKKAEFQTLTSSPSSHRTSE